MYPGHWSILETKVQLCIVIIQDGSAVMHRQEGGGRQKVLGSKTLHTYAHHQGDSGVVPLSTLLQIQKVGVLDLKSPLVAPFLPTIMQQTSLCAQGKASIWGGKVSASHGICFPELYVPPG